MRPTHTWFRHNALKMPFRTELNLKRYAGLPFATGFFLFTLAMLAMEKGRPFKPHHIAV
jgi:hypothetical protein